MSPSLLFWVHLMVSLCWHIRKDSLWICGTGRQRKRGACWPGLLGLLHFVYAATMCKRALRPNTKVTRAAPGGERSKAVPGLKACPFIPGQELPVFRKRSASQRQVWALSFGISFGHGFELVSSFSTEMKLLWVEHYFLSGFGLCGWLLLHEKDSFPDWCPLCSRCVWPQVSLFLQT